MLVKSAPLIFLLVLSLAQESKASIQSGRPGQAIGAGVLEAGFLQMQTGVEQFKYNGMIHEVSVDSASNVIRLGLNQRFELSAAFNYQKLNSRNTEVEDLKGLNTFNLGFRSLINNKQRGVLPQMAIQTRFKLKAVNENYRAKAVAPLITLSALHKMPGEYALLTNVGISFDGNGGDPHEFYVFNLSRTVNSKVSVFFEVFGNTEEQKSNLFIDTGFDYLLNNNMKLDFSGGWGNNESVQALFVSIGFSVRAKVFSKI
ncbi:MAG: transporter [Bdellovibrionales bacterium]